MKTIELMINGQKAQFTTKSVTLEGKEYFYSKMTKLDHSPVVHTYKIECDGEEKLLTYEKKDAKILAAIFSQVHKMIEMKKEKAAAAVSEQKAPAAVSEEKTEAAAVPEKKAEVAEASVEMDEMVKATIALNEERAKKEAEKAARKAKKKAIKEAKKNGTPLPEEAKPEDTAEETAGDAAPVDPEKQAKLKKSFKVFGIVLAVMIVLSVAYYVIFGTNTAPAGTNPNITESQQYEDVDQLIEDLQ